MQIMRHLPSFTVVALLPFGLIVTISTFWASYVAMSLFYNELNLRRLHGLRHLASVD